MVKVTKFKKFDSASRFRIYKRVSELMTGNVDTAQMTAILQDEGFKNPSGDDLTGLVVSGIRTRIATGKYVFKGGAIAVAAEPKKPMRLPSTVVGILTDPDLDENQKIKMIMAYADIEVK